MRIYIAGPYSAPTPGRVLENVNAAIDAGIDIHYLGHTPFIPHLTYLVEARNLMGKRGLTYETYLRWDFEWLARCQGLLHLAPSPGANRERRFAEESGITVYDSIQDIPLNNNLSKPKFLSVGRFSDLAGDSDFFSILEEIAQLHAKKNRDYGTDEDPLANIRASQNWGIPPWLGALVRGGDKLTRLQTFARKGTLANEGVEDSLLDLAAYAIIALRLFRETKQPQP